MKVRGEGKTVQLMANEVGIGNKREAERGLQCGNGQEAGIKGLGFKVQRMDAASSL